MLKQNTVWCYIMADVKLQITQISIHLSIILLGPHFVIFFVADDK